MFHFPGCASCIKYRMTAEADRFPYSEISGSKIARHLPEAYRSFTTSFFAIRSQGIHHTPLALPLGMLKTTKFVNYFCKTKIIFSNFSIPQIWRSQIIVRPKFFLFWCVILPDRRPLCVFYVVRQLINALTYFFIVNDQPDLIFLFQSVLTILSPKNLRMMRTNKKFYEKTAQRAAWRTIQKLLVIQAVFSVHLVFSYVAESI
jgi:hypothetical protein